MQNPKEKLNSHIKPNIKGWEFVDSHEFAGSHWSRGFVVLYTVLISTIILAITIGIALIAYNQVILSSSVAEGGEAFFAADSGAECALYWDRQSPSRFREFIDNGSPSDIPCGGISNNPLTSPETDKARFYLDIYNGDFTESIGCAKVTVDKGAIDEDGNTITEIISLGYNVKCSIVQDFDDIVISQLPPRTIQRAIRVTY